MTQIITHLVVLNQHLISQINELLVFIAKHIPLKQYKFDDSNSPKYQKFKVDKLPKVCKPKQLDYQQLLEDHEHKYGKPIKPVKRRKGSEISEDIKCPCCGAPHQYVYKNNGDKGQYLCKVCKETFTENNYRTLKLQCPYCNHSLVSKKKRKHFVIHKCTNKKCIYYLNNLSKLPKDLNSSDKYKYKLHYIYREFVVDFFKMNLHELPQNAVNFSFRKFSPHIMGLCLTYHVNLKLSTRKTAQALKEIHGVKISHTMVANYAMTAATVIKPFVDSFDYSPSNTLAADETYIKVKGITHYVWFVMDALKKSILGYHVSESRDVGPCILTMRMAFEKFKTFPGKALKFISDGYSAYMLARQQFLIHKGWDFDVTQVIGLTNDDPVTTEYRWIKQIIERLNRTFKATYRVTGGYGCEDLSTYGVTLWVAYYNFLRPHPYTYWKPLNEVEELNNIETMPAKWQILLRLGQEKILEIQQNTAS